MVSYIDFFRKWNQGNFFSLLGYGKLGRYNSLGKKKSIGNGNEQDTWSKKYLVYSK